MQFHSTGFRWNDSKISAQIKTPNALFNNITGAYFHVASGMRGLTSQSCAEFSFRFVPALQSKATMALTKKSPSASKARSSSSNNAISLKKVKGENFYRDAKQVARLKMYNGGKAVRDKDGKIIQAAAFQKTEAETKPGRVQPDKRWFGNCSFIRVFVVVLMDSF